MTQCIKKSKYVPPYFSMSEKCDLTYYENAALEGLTVSLSEVFAQ
jgi:hypothetical protein